MNGTCRPYTVLSCAITLDGYLDDAHRDRLVISGPEDLDRVDAERARADAILVGAATVRNDNPRLLVRSRGRIEKRLAQGRAAQPAKVTITERIKLDPDLAFFTGADTHRFVYCPDDRLFEACQLLSGRATVIGAGTEVHLSAVLADLHSRGVARLLVEGGATIHTQFLAQGLADELQLAIAPIFVGDSQARRWTDDAEFRWRGADRARLVESRTVGDVVLIRYALSSRCES